MFGLIQSLHFFLRLLFGIFFVNLILSDLGEPGSLLLGLFLGETESLLPFFGGLALRLLLLLLLVCLRFHLLTDPVGLCLLLGDLLLLLCLLVGKLALFLLEIGKLPLLIFDRVGLSGEEVHGVISLDLPVCLKLELLLRSVGLGKSNLLLLFLLLMFSDLLLERLFLLLGDLLELSEMLDGSILIVDDVFVGVRLEGSLRLLL